MAYYIVLPFGLAFSLFFCIRRRKGFSLSNLILKAISSLCFLLTATFALVSNSSAYIYGSLIVFGGALGLVGDVLLDLKGIYKKDASTYLLGGFIFFLVGHLFYSGAIIYQAGIKWWIALICLGASVIISISNIYMAKITKVHFGAYRKIVFFYVIFLSLTMLLAIAAVLLTGFKEKKYILLAVGAICFTLSDVVLSGTFFGKGKDTGFYYFINHFLYYAGQYLIASSILFM